MSYRQENTISACRLEKIVYLFNKTYAVSKLIYIENARSSSCSSIKELNYIKINVMHFLILAVTLSILDG